MRILLASQFPLAWPGSGLLTRLLGQGLQDGGHDVRVISVEPHELHGSPALNSPMICGLGGHVPFPVPVLPPGRSGHPRLDELSDQQVAAYRDGLRRLLDEQVSTFDPHVIHGQHASLLGELILETGVPYVLTCHRAELSHLADPFRPLAEQAAENAGRLIVSTRWLQGAASAAFNLDRSPLLIRAPAAATRSRNSEKNAHPLVVCFTDAGSQPEASAMLNAAARYEAAGEPIQTIIFSDDQLLPELKMQVSVLGLEHVTLSQFAGTLDDQAIEAVTGSAAAVMATSDADLGEALAIQCMALGTPVISSGEQGLSEIVDDEVGQVVPLDDHELLAERVVQAVQERWPATKGRAAKARAMEVHALQPIVQQLLSVYQQVLLERLGHIPPDA